MQFLLKKVSKTLIHSQQTRQFRYAPKWLKGKMYMIKLFEKHLEDVKILILIFRKKRELKEDTEKERKIFQKRVTLQDKKDYQNFHLQTKDGHQKVLLMNYSKKFTSIP